MNLNELEQQVQTELQLVENALPECYYKSGIKLHKEGRSDEARAHLSKALELREDYSGAHYTLGRLLANNKEHQEAVQHLTRAVELQPGILKYQHSLAAAYSNSGDNDKAEVHLAKALEIDGNHAASHRQLAFIYHSKDDDKAIVALRNAIACEKANGQRAKDWNNLARLLKHKGNNEEALEAIEQGLSIMVNESSFHHTRYKILAAEGRYSEGLESIREASRIDDNDALITLDLALCMERVGDFQGSEETIDRILGSHKVPAAFNLKGILLLAREVYDGAAEHFELAAEKGGTHFLMKAGLAWYQAGEEDKAMDLFDTFFQKHKGLRGYEKFRREVERLGQDLESTRTQAADLRKRLGRTESERRKVAAEFAEAKKREGKLILKAESLNHSLDYYKTSLPDPNAKSDLFRSQRTVRVLGALLGMVSLGAIVLGVNYLGEKELRYEAEGSIHEEIIVLPDEYVAGEVGESEVVSESLPSVRQPTSVPMEYPTSVPTTEPASAPTRNPTSQPTPRPAGHPIQPDIRPAGYPTSQPTPRPAGHPIQPDIRPAGYPTSQPTPRPQRRRRTRTETPPVVPTRNSEPEEEIQETAEVVATTRTINCGSSLIALELPREGNVECTYLSRDPLSLDINVTGSNEYFLAMPNVMTVSEPLGFRREIVSDSVVQFHVYDRDALSNQFQVRLDRLRQQNARYAEEQEVIAGAEEILARYTNAEELSRILEVITNIASTETLMEVRGRLEQVRGLRQEWQELCDGIEGLTLSLSGYTNGYGDLHDRFTAANTDCQEALPQFEGVMLLLEQRRMMLREELRTDVGEVIEREDGRLNEEGNYEQMLMEAESEGLQR